MHTVTLLLTGFLLCLAAYFLFSSPKIKRHGQPLKRPLNTLPIVGNGILFLQARHKLFSWFVKCERQFGFETFQISVPSLPPGVVINDPKNLEYVLKNEGIFAKGDFFKRRSRDLFGNGIINSDGDLWKLQRKAGLHFLSNANLKVLTDIALPKYIRTTIETLQSHDMVATLDLEEVFHELTTQLMGRMAYNMDIHNKDPFSRAFDFASGATGKRFQNPLWQITEVFFGGQFKNSIQIVKAFGSKIVKSAVQDRKKKLSGNESSPNLGSISGSLINSLLDSINDEQMVADAALNYLSAGRDTTAQALTWTFYLLMKHPSQMATARDEASKALAHARNEGPSHSSEDINPSVFLLSSLPFVTAVFYEALRLYPPVPFELKQCEKATTLPDGTFLPKLSIVVWCTWAMNRSKLTWGDNSEQFEPSRWLENGVFVSKTAYDFPVFNGGPRTCLGKKMAELVAVQVIASLIVKFDFKLLDTMERISKNSLTLPMDGGLPCFVRPYNC